MGSLLRITPSTLHYIHFIFFTLEEPTLNEKIWKNKICNIFLPFNPIVAPTGSLSTSMWPIKLQLCMALSTVRLPDTSTFAANPTVRNKWPPVKNLTRVVRATPRLSHSISGLAAAANFFVLLVFWWYVWSVSGCVFWSLFPCFILMKTQYCFFASSE
jgi:hypothetical protein